MGLSENSDMKPRLLFVSNLFPDVAEPYRGLDNATVLHALRAHYEIRVVSPRPWLPFLSPAWPKTPRPRDSPFHPLFIRAPYLPRIGGLANHRLMAAALRAPLRQLHQSFPWDRVLGSWLFPDGWALQKVVASLTPGIPTSLIAQGSDVHAYLRSAPRRRAILDTLASVHGVITRSRSLAELLAAAGAAPEKLHPVYNGVETRLFHGQGRAEARAELSIDPKEYLLLFVGNFLPVKDPLRLIRHFAALIHRLPEHRLRLVMIGKGPLETAADELARSLGLGPTLQRTGPLLAEDVARWMRAADLLCMTSQNEGLPNVVLEAQACGVPVLSTRVGGLHEVIDEPWKGELTPLEDIPAWEDAACRLIKSVPANARIATLGATRTWDSAALACRNAIEPS